MTGTNGHHSSEPGSPPMVEGTVQSRNERGIRVDGDWFNVSKFKPVDVPDIGTRVRLTVDAKGFITSLEIVKPAQDETPAHLSQRDDRITRLAVLKAAAEFVGLWGQSREDVKSDHVLLIADKWLAWVTQDDR